MASDTVFAAIPEYAYALGTGEVDGLEGVLLMGLPRVNAEAPRRACLGSAANGLCAAVAGVSRLEAPARPAAAARKQGAFCAKTRQPRVSVIGSARRAVAGRAGAALVVGL